MLATNDVRVVPINAIGEIKEPSDRYVVIGAGKDGIDAVLYLLDRGVDPDRIRWIMPNDAWFLNRENVMPRRLANDLPGQPLGCSTGGTSSNFSTDFARADLALSISMTVCSTIFGILAIPLVLSIYTRPWVSPELEVPYSSIVTALVAVIVPVALGVPLRSKNALWAKRWARQRRSASPLPHDSPFFFPRSRQRAHRGPG